MAIKTYNTVDLTPAAVYTSLNDSAITFMSLCNRSGSAVTIDIYIVPATDGSPSANNQFASQLEINAGDTYILYQGGEKILLSNGDAVYVASSVANVVTVIVSYTGY